MGLIKIMGGIFLLLLGFLMGFVYGTELGRIVWDAIFEFIKGRFSGG